MPDTKNATGVYKCSACGESFDSQLELREHEKDCIQKSTPATATQK